MLPQPPPSFLNLRSQRPFFTSCLCLICGLLLGLQLGALRELLWLREPLRPGGSVDATLVEPLATTTTPNRWSTTTPHLSNQWTTTPTRCLPTEPKQSKTMSPLPALAIVISGQVSRFVYQHSLASIIDAIRLLLDCRGNTSSCRGVADVYIVLGDTRVTPWTGSYDRPPYADDVRTKPEQVRSYYTAKGINGVSLCVYSKQEFDRMIDDLEAQVALEGSRSVGSSPQAFRSTWKKFENRWLPSRGMHLLRYLAYQSSLDAERNLPYNYSHFLVMREDNVFLEDVDLKKLVLDLDTLQPPRSTAPAVLVDAKCGWGFFSDKLWLANRGAASVLFGGTPEEHVRHMAVLLLGGNFFSQTGMKKGMKSPGIQPENYYQFLLEVAGAKVKKVAFNRTDLRFVAGQGACIPSLYYGCTRSKTPFPVCHP